MSTEQRTQEELECQCREELGSLGVCIIAPAHLSTAAAAATTATATTAASACYDS